MEDKIIPLSITTLSIVIICFVLWLIALIVGLVYANYVYRNGVPSDKTSYAVIVGVFFTEFFIQLKVLMVLIFTDNLNLWYIVTFAIIDFLTTGIPQVAVERKRVKQAKKLKDENSKVKECLR
jgi:hypothetical protein